jgi:hypothetical protein
MTTGSGYRSVRLSDVAARLIEIGVYDRKLNRPVFGWRPILQGWRIAILRTGSATRIFLNGVAWDGNPVPWGQPTQYSPHS